MLRLESHLRLDDAVCEEPNLTSRFSAEDLQRIGEECFEGFQRDEQSRGPWLRRTQAAMDLAMQLVQAKSFPWPNASNVAFPLITIAALQFHSRAYPALFAGPDLVKYRVAGEDPMGQLADRARRVSRFMSHQCLDLDEAFEEQHDRLLLSVPIVGCVFVKTRFDAARGHNVSELVLARDLVVDYWAKSIEAARRKTQQISMYRNDVWERCESGVFRDIREEAWYTVPFAPPKSPADLERDRILGRTQTQPDESTPILLLEQHTWLDLDGDGYAEPYIVTLEPTHRYVVRIVARWEMPEDVTRRGQRVQHIRATEYYTKFGLIPNPEGGIYDTGFGMLLGPLNESVNTLVNQLVDAGTMSVAAGGFFSRGVKIRGGSFTFSPFGWRQVDATGDDLRKGIFPLPVREPSNVLFSLLTLLVNYTQRISGSTDTMVGENPGQNTPASNMQEMVKQGMQIYNALFKRQWRSLRDEFRKLYMLNARYLPMSLRFGEGRVGREDFLQDPSSILPAADPNMTSETALVQQAVAVKQSAMGTPGYNLPEVEKRYLRALRVDGIEVIYPGPDKVPPLKNPRVQVEEIKTQREQMKMQAEQQQFVIEMMEERRLNDAKIGQLEAQAAKLLAEAQGAGSEQEVNMVRLAVETLKSHNEILNKRIELMIKQLDVEVKRDAIEAKKEQPSAAPGK